MPLNDLTKQIQTALNRRGKRLKVDGAYGPKTARAFLAVLDQTDPSEPDKNAINNPLKDPEPANTITLQKARRPVSELVWHCTATPDGRDVTVDDIRTWHKKRGWSDIGYHYVITRDGVVHAGRPVQKTGAHAKGHNTGTIGACYVGGLTASGKRAEDTRTPAQRAAMLWLTKQLATLHHLKKISGHNQYAAKACPCFDVRRDELGNIPGFRRGARG